MEDRERYYSDKKYKDKKVVVEWKYIGKYPFNGLKEWTKYRLYKNSDVAEKAVNNLNRKYKSFVYRVRL